MVAGSARGKGWIEASAGPWLAPVLIVCLSVVGGAVLLVAGGVFYGLGDRLAEDPQMVREAADATSENVRWRSVSRTGPDITRTHGSTWVVNNSKHARPLPRRSRPLILPQ